MLMAKLTKNDTKRVAEFAKLTLDPAEIDKFTPQLGAVIELMSQLNEVDTKDVESTARTINLENVLRDDEIKIENCLIQDEALSGTENTKNGFFVVPQILHNEENT
jgi:aspartyl-tRNA(Asn)/glutamyl-tRNA(Gln) amidotransferase subunit C